MNIDNAIKKLDEIVSKYKAIRCQEPKALPALREILIAMKEPSEDIVSLACDERFKHYCQWKENIEKRLEALEVSNNINTMKINDHIFYDCPAPTKPCGCLVGHECAGDTVGGFKNNPHKYKPLKSKATITIDRRVAEEWLKSISIKPYPGAYLDERLENELKNQLGK